MNCVICGNKRSKLVCINYPGYVEGTTFNIFSCDQCNSKFISPTKLSDGIYELIYSSVSVNGMRTAYDTYYSYTRQIKLSMNPLKFLLRRDEIYAPVFKYVKDKSNLKILEVGCGYGYLTYALNYLKHETVGIDISATAIGFALKNFGNNFVCSDIESFAKKSKKKYDLIIALEVIEHLPNPLKFLQTCSRMLNKDGLIILTTPNKDFYRRDSFWQPELPPVHLVLFSRKSFLHLADKYKLNARFFVFSNPFIGQDNKFASFLLTRFERKAYPVLGKTGRRIVPNSKFFKLKKIIWAFINFGPVRILSNFFYYNFVSTETPTLAVMLSEKGVIK